MTLLLLALGLGCTGQPESENPAEAPVSQEASGTSEPPAPKDEPGTFRMASETPAKHAVIIVIDTLRADRQRAASTPTLDALVEAGAHVPRAWSSGTWTVPSVVSLLTGMSVRQHGFDEPTGLLGRYPALPAVPLLAEELTARGFVSNGFYANPYLAEDLGFDRGFATWRRSVDKAIPGQVASLVEKSWDDGQRHFLYLHLIGPHSPLRPTEEARVRHELAPEWFEERNGLNIGMAKRNRPVDARRTYHAAYDAVIEDTDTRVAEILEGLGEHRADTAVLVTSDHGELLGEHNIYGHGYWLWEPLTHVPFIVDHPHLDGPDESLPDTLTIASAPALLFTMLGLEAGPWPVAADAALPLVSQREGKLALSADGRHKGVWHSPNSSASKVFDLDADPAEEDALPTDHGLPAARAAFEEDTPEGRLGPDEVQLDESTREELEQLGYLGKETEEP